MIEYRRRRKKLVRKTRMKVTFQTITGIEHRLVTTKVLLTSLNSTSSS